MQVNRLLNMVRGQGRNLLIYSQASKTFNAIITLGLKITKIYKSNGQINITKNRIS